MHLVKPPRLLITKGDAQAALAPIHGILYESLELSWQLWERDIRKFFARPRRALQTCMNDLAEQHLRMRLGATPNVKLPENDAERFWIELPTLMVFIKKFRHGFGISHYDTETAQDFIGQQRLPGVPDLPRVTAGYFVTNTRDQLVGVHVAFLTDKNRSQWNYRLQRDPADGGRVIVAPEHPSLPIKPRELTLKPGVERKKKDAEQ